MGWFYINIINNMNKYEEDQGEDEFANEKVIIGLVARRGRKHSTQVKNIPSVFDLDRMFKYWRKVRDCCIIATEVWWVDKGRGIDQEQGKQGGQEVLHLITW